VNFLTLIIYYNILYISAILDKFAHIKMLTHIMTNVIRRTSTYRMGTIARRMSSLPEQDKINDLACKIDELTNKLDKTTKSVKRNTYIIKFIAGIAGSAIGTAIVLDYLHM
jgi:hypothetical protein